MNWLTGCFIGAYLAQLVMRSKDDPDKGWGYVLLMLAVMGGTIGALWLVFGAPK